MSNRNLGPHLYARQARNGRQDAWIIRDGETERSTKCRLADREGANKELAKYIAEKYNGAPQPTGGDRRAASVKIADVLNHYAKRRPNDKRKGELARPEELGRRVVTLLKFWRESMVADITALRLAEYAESRAPHFYAARRELEDLSAAIGYAIDFELLVEDKRPVIKANLPEKAPPRERWLTRSEAAKLIWACWRYRQPQRGKLTDRFSRRHIARFILVGLYTGSRSAAICGAAIGPAIGRGYVDTAEGIFYRRAPSTRETTKKRPPVNLPKRLLAHIRRWEKLGISRTAVVEYDGAPVASVKKGFERAVEAAGLENVTPHTLRHTMITWSLRRGVSTWQTAQFAGVSEQLIRAVYGHHCVNDHAVVGDAITRSDRARQG